MTKTPAKIIADGRVTIPKDERDRYDLTEGDWVLIDVEPFDEEAKRKQLGGV